MSVRPFSLLEIKYFDGALAVLGWDIEGRPRRRRRRKQLPLPPLPRVYRGHNRGGIAQSVGGPQGDRAGLT